MNINNVVCWFADTKYYKKISHSPENYYQNSMLLLWLNTVQLQDFAACLRVWGQTLSILGTYLKSNKDDLKVPAMWLGNQWPMHGVKKMWSPFVYGSL